MPAVATATCHRLPLSAILPPAVTAALAGGPTTSQRLPALSAPGKIRHYLRTPKHVKPSEWAAKHRYVPDSAHVGLWRHEYAPHTVQIMDTFGKPWVREIWFCGVEQSGKSNSMINCLCWAIEQSPGNAFYLMPSEDTAKKVVAGKLRPTLERTPRLAKFLTGRADDLALDQLRLANGITIFPAHANSPAAQATWSAKHVFADEVDKYPELSGKETSPIELIRKRTRTYRGRSKCFFASTPAGRFISAGTYDCHQVWQYRAKCPHCKELIRMEVDHLCLPKDATPTQVEIEGCEVACHRCGRILSESDRLKAIRKGQWIAIKGAELPRPARVGFHHRAWDCLDISLREIGAAYLRSKNGSLAEKIAWANGYEAVDYEHVQVDRKEEFILRLRDANRPRGVVPADAACLLLLCDTQKRGFYYGLWAIGYGPNCAAHMVDHGYVERFTHLVDISKREWLDTEGKARHVARAYIDSGGGTDPNLKKHSRTAAVYEHCRRNRTFRPLKGNTRQEQIWAPMKIDYYPTLSGKKVPMPDGPILYKVNVQHFKDELADKLLIEAGDPGGITLHAETDEAYAKQLCAEYTDPAGRWICPRGRDNHHWDIAVYLRAAIAIEGLDNQRKQQAHKRAAAPLRKSFVRGWR